MNLINLLPSNHILSIAESVTPGAGVTLFFYSTKTTFFHDEQFYEVMLATSKVLLPAPSS